MSKVFHKVGGNRPGRSVFNLSYEKKMTADMGLLYPVMADEMVPGDIFEVGNQIVLRFMPMVAPMLHEVNVYTHYFFVPYRLLWDEWEDFITGGADGEYSATLPTWIPTGTGSPADNAEGSLWDYFGFPIDTIPDGAYPLSFTRRAYNFIYNEYYRDETLIDEVDLDQTDILRRAWEKDYFTSALPWQQRGTAPALPVTIVGADRDITFQNETDSTNRSVWTYSTGTQGERLGLNTTPSGDDAARWGDPALESVSFNIADLRLAAQIQRWLERNARAGARYTEFLHSHFAVSPRDSRLQRPEYIGGSKSPVIVSEVLQTSETSTSPQGNLAGHGITVDSRRVGKYRAEEYGIIIGIMSVMPRSAYQQGIDRQWLRRTKYDFYFPEFANLSEQAIEQAEIVATDTASENNTVFGYQGRYDEMRVKRNMVCGYMRDTFDYWHLGRIFNPASPPVLNQDFIECNPSKRTFAVQDEPVMVVNYGNVIKAVRPMPAMSNPGLTDH